MERQLVRTCSVVVGGDEMKKGKVGSLQQIMEDNGYCALPCHKKKFRNGVRNMSYKVLTWLPNSTAGSICFVLTA